MDNTASTEPQTAAENIPATNATPTAETPAAEIADAPEPTAESRDFTAAVNQDHAKPFRRTTRQFDLGDNRRLVDMRPSNGGLDIIPEVGADFADVPAMSRDDAILAALDFDGMSDKDKLALVRQIVTATR